MKSDVITVSSKGGQMEKALKQAEKVASYKGLSRKSTLHLTLLTEEMMGLMRSIAGDVEGKFWIEDNKDEFQLHLQVETPMDAEKREQLISVSSSGKNEASQGFMGRIRAFFEPEEDLPLFLNPVSVDSFDGVTDVTWSMIAYREMLTQYVGEHREEAKDAWDELEKSVVSHVADDVKVSIRGRKVELTILKKLA